MSNDGKHQALVLASGSRTRYEILKSAGLSFTVDPADIDEQALKDTIQKETGAVDPSEIALELARAKALAISASHNKEVVIGGDQILALDGEIFSKPRDRHEAMRTLTALRGKTHALHAAVAIARSGKVTWHHVETARLTMRAFTDAFAMEYLTRVGDDAYLSVGAYQIEGPGIQLFDKIDGDYFTILGLPILPLLKELRRTGDLHE